jgi:hypothetical protein
MTGALTCLDITVSAGTVTFATGTSPTLAISGSMTLISGTVWSSTGTTTFNATTTGKTVTTGGTTLAGAVTFNGPGGGWTLGSALTTSGNFTFSAGTFDTSTNNYAVTSTNFQCTGSGTKVLTLNSSIITCSGLAVSLSTSNTTFNVYSATFVLSSASAKNFTTNAVTLTVGTVQNSGAGIITFVVTTGGVPTFTTIQNTVQPTGFKFTSSSAGAITTNITNFLVSGTSGNLVTVGASTAGTQATISKTSGTVSCDYLALTDSNATGGATWYAGANSTGSSGANNTGWTFTAAPTVTTGDFFLMM